MHRFGGFQHPTSGKLAETVHKSHIISIKIDLKHSKQQSKLDLNTSK